MTSLVDVLRRQRHPRHDAAFQIVKSLGGVSKLDELNRCELRTHAALAVNQDVSLLWNGLHGTVNVRVGHLEVAAFYPNKGVLVVGPNVEDERLPAVVSSLNERVHGEVVEHTVRCVSRGFLFLRHR
mgnify:CR=1 FL=1